MNTLLILIPVALFLGLLGLAAFLWAMRSGQFEDLEGAGHRILFDAPAGDHPASSGRTLAAHRPTLPAAEGNRSWSTH